METNIYRAVKASLENNNEDIRRFALNTKNFEWFRAAIAESFGLQDQKFSIRYKDDEGDYVIISNNLELSEAYNICKDILRVFIRIENAKGPQPDSISSGSSVNSVIASETVMHPAISPMNHDIDIDTISDHISSNLTVATPPTAPLVVSTPPFVPLDLNYPAPLVTATVIPATATAPLVVSTSPIVPLDFNYPVAPVMYPIDPNYSNYPAFSYPNYSNYPPPAVTISNTVPVIPYSQENPSGLHTGPFLKAKQTREHLQKAKKDLSNTKEQISNLKKQLETDVKEIKKYKEDKLRMIKNKDGNKNIMGRFVKHITIPDNTELAPNTAFFKIWRFRNESNKPWPAASKLIFIGKSEEDCLAIVKSIDVGTLDPGKEKDISVTMKTPPKQGRYISYWKLYDPVVDKKFGQRVWAMVNVVSDSSSSSSGDEKESAVPSEVLKKFEAALCQLQEMGFVDNKRNVKYLIKFNGDLNAAVKKLVKKAGKKEKKKGS